MTSIPLPPGRPARAGSPPAAWHVVPGRASVTARSADGEVAEAVLCDDEELLRVDVRASRPLPARTAAALVTELFRGRAFRRSRPVQVALPAGHHEVFTEVHGRLADVDAHVAGATCLLTGRVR